MKEDRPIHLKFGYEHMLEMRQIRRNLRAEGFDGVSLYFAARRAYDRRHENDLSWRQRQEIAREAGAKWVLPAERDDLPSDYDVLRAALEAIRDGHNDPRALAARVLSEVQIPGLDEVRVEIRT